MPFVRDRKWKKKWVLSERSEFRPLPIFCPAQTGTPQGQRRRGRLSLLTFFGEAKKVSGRRATPGNALLHGETTVSATKTTIKKAHLKVRFLNHRTSNYLATLFL